MDRFDDDTLLAELRELRPEPRPEFTAELDEWAAAGFPRRSPRPGANPFARLVAAWRSSTPRRRLVPVVGFAVLVLAVSAVIVATSGGGGSSDLMMTSATSESAESSSSGGEEASESGGRVVHGKVQQSAPYAKAEESAGAEVSDGEIEEEAEGGEHSGEEVPEKRAETSENTKLIPFAAPESPLRSQRDIERSASIVLGTKPGEVSGAAAKVYQAVHAVNGVVLNSSVSSGKAGATGATFSLLIPSRKLDDALASFSQIAEVRSRHDGTNDITAPTVGATEELRDSNASIEGLLKELGDVETESQRESVEARLREERRHHASIRASLDHLHKRAAMSEVSLRIVTANGAGVAAAGKGNGNWSVGDALHDAGHILTIAAGVLLIALAILAPIALIALLIWLVARFRVRRLRERTLG
jgi:Domain of unknown function (DUF4349)